MQQPGAWFLIGRNLCTVRSTSYAVQTCLIYGRTATGFSRKSTNAFGWTKDSGAGEAMLSLAVICNEASTQATLASHGCTRDAHGGQATGGILPNATIAHVSYEGPSVNTRHASCWKRCQRPCSLTAQLLTGFPSLLNETTSQAGDRSIHQLQREDALKPQDMGSFALETCYH
ncbi:hypothetical protein FOC4_g10011861 [Fusarium odoratissimum]|uniref:Uncharacterized protein n=1 Tax=Fusarium oxysporum f. sp. cubense (strain race 4) TaxID=2502994 RepID=N1R754_FUSC4|nr:hypothetical protein FOC4_g10011861 [Fusarium odoratissimum]